MSRILTAALLIALGLVLARAGVEGVAVDVPGVDLPGGADAAGGVLSEGRVTRVVDGDTIIVGSERVRLIGADTPETKKPGTPVQCFGKRATAFTRKLVEGRRVRLELDVEHRDRYGRLLAYVKRSSDGLHVNAELIRRGYAQPMTIPPNVRHAAQFARLAGRARREGRGLWRACA